MQGLDFVDLKSEEIGVLDGLPILVAQDADGYNHGPRAEVEGRDVYSGNATIAKDYAIAWRTTLVVHLRALILVGIVNLLRRSQDLASGHCD